MQCTRALSHNSKLHRKWAEMPSEVFKVLWEYVIVKIGHGLFVSTDGIPPSSLETIGTQDDN